MLQRLAEAIERHSDGLWSGTAVPRQILVAVDRPLAPTDQLYEPMICFIAAGAKRSVAGDSQWATGAGEMFFNSLALPVTAVFEPGPYRSAVLRLEGAAIADMLLELDGTGPHPPPAEAAARGSAPMSDEIIDAVLRWVRLLDTPDDIGPLAGRIEGEILYRLLAGPLGPSLRQWSLADTAAARIRRVATWIVGHYAEPIAIEGLAAAAHMSPATLHRHFKSATGMSPLRFQKQLRLQEARRRLLAGEGTAAQIAHTVGYASATQFNREYRRFYGLPPGQDTDRLRTLTAGLYIARS